MDKDTVHEIDELLIQESFNPFPGLRPFGVNESHLFFGREGQSEEVLDKLSQNKFVAIVGASGSGKSSLVFSGLIPTIYGGFVTKTSDPWTIVLTNPGTTPVSNLSESLIKSVEGWEDMSEEDFELKKTITSTVLRTSSVGLIEAIRQFKAGEQRNYLLVVDQFEELFRYQHSLDHDTGYNESLAYINLLLEAIDQSQVPIYIALTLRSDFIGDCAQFPDLTQRINNSHYLIPQMTRDQKKRAIAGPIAVGGGEISNRLMQKLLNDLGDNLDQLPLLQHALMRTWDYWMSHRDMEEPVDLRHYEEIGTIHEALSMHANEAYDELDDESKRICEVIFKSITEQKGTGEYGIRRPTSIGVIANIAETAPEEVIKVVDKFRQPGRSLLMPAPGVELDNESVVDISHESLMRIWTRLREWVEDESEASQMYLRLSEAARNYQLGKTGLWRPPDLQLGLNWVERYHPTLDWAQRYDPAFERAMVFLRTSKEEHEAEQRGKELLQKNRLKRANRIAVVLAGIAILALIFLVFAFQQQTIAKEQATIARNNEIEAEKNAEEAREQADLARKAQILAEEQRQIAVSAQEQAVAEALAAEEARSLAETQRQEALRQRAIALQQEELASLERDNAERQTEIAIIEKERADAASLDALNRRYQAIAQSMAVKSVAQKETDIKGLNALQAYYFNTEYGGEPYDNYIYDGLYYARKAVSDDNDFQLFGHVDGVNDMVMSKDGKELFTAGSDGNINRWDLSDNSKQIIYTNIENENRALALSPDQRWLVNGTSERGIQLFDLSKNNPAPQRIRGHEGIVWDIDFLSDNKGFYSTGLDSTIRYYDFKEFTVFNKGEVQYNGIALSPDGSTLAAGDARGRVTIWNLNTGKSFILKDENQHTAQDLTFNHAGTRLVVSHAIGDEDVELKIWNTSTWQLENLLTGHEARIDKLVFSNDDKLLASASHDGTVRVWVMDKLTNLPIVMNDHNGWVLSVAFTPDGSYLYAGTSINQIRIWPTRPELMAKDFCNNLTRNMSQEEWEQYVADDIPYIETCNGLPKP